VRREPAPRETQMTPSHIEPPAEHPVEVHALRLLLWVQEDWRVGDEILARDLEVIYREICSELWWKPLRWRYKNGVAHHFRLLNGDPLYRWTRDSAGQRHRRLSYPIRAPARTLEPGRVSARRRHELCLELNPKGALSGREPPPSAAARAAA
jgi:hypothetical protein